MSMIPQVHQSSKPLSLLMPKPFVHGNSTGFPVRLSRSSFAKTSSNRNNAGLIICKPSSIKAMATVSAEPASKVKATVTMNFNTDSSTRSLDVVPDVLGSLELFFNDLDPSTREERSITSSLQRGVQLENGDVQYDAEFEVPPGYGQVGGVDVTNKQAGKEIFVKDMVLQGLPLGPITLTCNSWVQVDQPRIFFTDKSTYLPSQTPGGLRRLRKDELHNLRGNGQGERQQGDRIYDYDVYNDLGNPDKTPDLARPVLGGKEHPYPRRCRTGRPPTQTDPSSESRSAHSFYVPRDENFSQLKQETYEKKKGLGVLRSLIPALQTAANMETSFPYFTTIDLLFNEGINFTPSHLGGALHSLPDNIEELIVGAKKLLRFTTPDVMKRDKFSWFSDEEFARQTVAGINPCVIQLVTEWPLKSELDPEIYGPAESVITTEIIEEEIKEYNMTVAEAMEHKKLFILDYHDLFLPFVRQVRELGTATLYGSRTLFFLTPDGTLTPLAIELTRPPMDGKPQWKRALTPNGHPTDVWLWRLAKANVLAQDSGYHQLISHWLNSHCSVEPYVIAANRQLSAMHPIYRLLRPHFRYTMEINAQAREGLITADGVIEKTFSPGKYSILMSSVIYDKQWQFDHQGLPHDLISRGLAVVDPSSPHGLKLAIEDYPYANDGLDLWNIIKQWVIDYVNHYYPNASLIESDYELQAWWTEVRNVGHGDKKDELWWPELKKKQVLIDTLTTIIWVASGYHAAVNFGQYGFAGYFPNRPTITRINMPNEDPKPDEWESFLAKPEDTLLKTFPSQLQAVQVLATLSILSEHSPDEEYIGQKLEPVWAEDPEIKRAFETFEGSVIEFQKTIEKRNADQNLRNRHGAGIVPYQLLEPFSEPGVTGKGVPCSISI